MEQTTEATPEPYDCAECGEVCTEVISYFDYAFCSEVCRDKAMSWCRETD